MRVIIAGSRTFNNLFKDIQTAKSSWNETSKGTKHMIDLANKHRLKVFVVKFR